jgi:predicted nuclease of predicted toxin-antitoxin system
MNLLVNENIPLDSVKILRQSSHDVLSIMELSPGITDKAVMTIAHEEKRIIVTFDRDYGELVFRKQLPLPLGVLYLRFNPVSPSEPADYISALLENGITLEGKFTTAGREHVRQRYMNSHIKI